MEQFTAEYLAADYGDVKGQLDIAGQLNIYVLDIDSDHTGFGKHNRLVVFGNPKQHRVEIREDLRGLPLSTEHDRQKFARGWTRQHPRNRRLRYIESIPDVRGRSIEHVYEY